MDQTLVGSPVHYCLCLSKKEFHVELARLKIKRGQYPQFVSDGADATTHHSERGGGGYAAIVCLQNRKGITATQKYALLVHEAVHIWQWIKGILGESDPSVELEAYSIQAISQNLLTGFRGR